MANPLEIIKKKADKGSTIGTVRDRADYQKYVAMNADSDNVKSFDEWSKAKNKK